MRRVSHILLNVVVWGALVAYFVFAVRQCRQEQAREVIEAVEIVVTDYDRLRAVSPQMVRGWLEDAGTPLEGSPLMEVNTAQIARLIASYHFVAATKTWIEHSGTLHIELSQRQPIMRVITSDGYDFYVSHDYWILPPQSGKGEYLPVVTGSFTLPFERGWVGALERDEQKNSDESYTFLLKLINFVESVASDPFWRDEIVQIVVSQSDGAPAWREPEVELVPRVGSHTIGMGTLDDARRKLEKLRLFYDSVLIYEGWDTYSSINIKYNNQVVCTK